MSNQQRNGNEQEILCATWIIDCKLDSESRTYTLEAEEPVSEWYAIRALIDHVATVTEGLHVLSSFEAIPGNPNFDYEGSLT